VDGAVNSVGTKNANNSRRNPPLRGCGGLMTFLVESEPMNQQTLLANWNEIKGRITEKWGEFSDDELQRAKGKSDQLIGLIQRKTGETKEAINEFLDSIVSGAGGIGDMLESARDYAASAGETVQEAAHQAADQVKAAYQQTERMVRRHPLESMAACFGIGIVTGFVTGLLVRMR
jgi:uncharacterized protein YjbJ (UPF0337 family)